MAGTLVVVLWGRDCMVNFEVYQGKALEISRVIHEFGEKSLSQ